VYNIPVDGREGTLTILHGWEDIRFNFRAALLSSGGGDFHKRFREILPSILNAKTIYFNNILLTKSRKFMELQKNNF
jgi:hypothetical protein